MAAARDRSSEDGAGDELTLAVGPAADVSHYQVVLTRAEVLGHLGARDGDGGVQEWFSSRDIPEQDMFLLGSLTDAARERRRRAADSLFLPAADPR